MSELIIRSLGEKKEFKSIEDLEISLSKDYTFKHITLIHKRKSGVLKVLYASVNKDGRLKETYGKNKDINLRDFLCDS